MTKPSATPPIVFVNESCLQVTSECSTINDMCKRARDELADKLYGRSGEFKEGFDAGYSHRDAEIERLVLCLEKLTRRHQWTPGMGDCICDPHLEAHELIEAHKKGRSE